MDQIKVVKEASGFRIMICDTKGEVLFRSDKVYTIKGNAASAGSSFARRHDKRSFEITKDRSNGLA